MKARTEVLFALITVALIVTTFDAISSNHAIMQRSPMSETLRYHVKRAREGMTVISQNLDQQLNSTEMGRGLKHTIQEHVLPATQAGVEKLSSGAAYLAKDVGERLNQSQYAREIAGRISETVSSVRDEIKEHLNETELAEMRDQFQDAAQELSEKLSVSLKRGGEAINESLGTLQSELDRRGILDAVRNSTAAISARLEEGGVYDALRNSTRAIHETLEKQGVYDNAKRLAEQAASYFTFALDGANRTATVAR